MVPSPLLGLARRLVPRRFHRSVCAQTIISARCHGTVVSGPFAGLRYVDFSVGSEFFPKLLGTYEKELHPIYNQLLAEDWPRVVNVGAGEGYYACGVAYRCPQVQVMAFEQEPAGRRGVQALAELNHLGRRVRVAGVCTRSELAQTLVPGGLLVVDVEGTEEDLLVPGELPQLRDQVCIVEVHDCYRPHVGEVLRARLEPHGHIAEFRTRPRTLADYPFAVNPVLRWYARDGFTRCLCERRPAEMRWFVFVPRARSRLAEKVGAAATRLAERQPTSRER